MFTYSINCSQLSSKNIITRCSVLLPEIVMHDAYIGGLFLPTKLTRKASNAAENLQLYRVVGFFHPRSSCMTHIPVDVKRITLNASFMTISGGRTKQLDIFCHVTGFTSDFLRFVVVELIRFFYRAFVVPGSYHDAKPVHKRLPVTDWTSAAVACLWRCWWEQQVHHSMLCNVCLCCKFTCVNVDVNHEHIESLDWTGIWRTGTAVCVLRKMIWSDWQWWVARANNMRSCAVSTANRPCWDNKSTNRWVCERVIKVKM